MRRKIDAHVHIDRIRESVEGTFDFRNPPPADIVTGEILQWMDSQRVERAVVMQHPNSPLNDEILRLFAEHPGRFQGAAVLPLDSGRDAVKEMERCARAGMRAIKFEMFGTELLYPGFRLDGPVAEAVYEAAQDLGTVITVDPSRMGTPAYQPDELERMTAKYADVQFVICHLGFAHGVLLQSRTLYRQWEAMTALAEQPNVAMDIAAMPDLYCKTEPWPYETALERIRQVADRCGTDKLLWGSDLPGELRVNTYGQIADMIEQSDRFSEEEKDRIFYKNAARIYFKEESGETVH